MPDQYPDFVVASGAGLFVSYLVGGAVGGIMGAWSAIVSLNHTIGLVVGAAFGGIAGGLAGAGITYAIGRDKRCNCIPLLTGSVGLVGLFLGTEAGRRCTVWLCDQYAK